MPAKARPQPTVADRASTIDVTVVVPVYNPGKYIELCIAGLLSQSLPRERFEVIFIDDGSTDESPERLDRLSAEYPDLVQVVHQPNSGWPGQPRNLGTDMARGDYIFHSDHDDQLGIEALERMVAMARRTKADVLIPKMVNRGRPVAQRLVRANIDRAVLGEDQVVQSLTPHKLFRRAFLIERGLRWAEGKIRLEDEMFVMEAYLVADVISVLADYPCYARIGRDDGGNAALGDWDAKYYYSFVERVIDIVEAHTEPGHVRNSMLMREYDGKMLRKVSGDRLLRRSPAQRQDIFDEVRRISIARFPADFHEQLPIAKRIYATAMLANRLDLMEDLAGRTTRVKPRAQLGMLTWREDRWIADVEGEMLHDDGSPILVIPAGDRWSLDPRLIPPTLDHEPFERDDIVAGGLDVVVIHRRKRVEWCAASEFRTELVPIDGHPDGAHRVVFRGTAELDPASLAGGRPLSAGKWEVHARIGAFGLGRIGPVTDESSPAGRLSAPGVVHQRRIVVSPHLNKKKRLRLRVASKRVSPAKAIARNVRDLSLAPDGGIVAALGLNVAPTALPWEVRLLFVDDNRTVVARRRGHVEPTPDGSALTSPAVQKVLRPGRLRLMAKWRPGRAVVFGVVDIDAAGKVVKIETAPSEPLQVHPPRSTH